MNYWTFFYLQTVWSTYMKALTDLISYMMTFFGNWNKPLIGENSFLTQPFLLDMSRSSPGEESRSLADKCQIVPKMELFFLENISIGIVSWVQTQVRARYFPPSFFLLFPFLTNWKQNKLCHHITKKCKELTYIVWTEAAIFLQFFLSPFVHLSNNSRIVSVCSVQKVFRILPAWSLLSSSVVCIKVKKF